MTTPPPTVRRPSKGRLLVLGLVAIFVLPIAIAWWLNINPPSAYTDIEVTGKGSKLVPGAPSISEGGLTPLDGMRPPTGYFQGTWTLLMVTESAACELSCTDALHMTRQIHHALGREIDRLHRVLAQTKALDDRGRQRLLAHTRSANVVLAALATPAWRDRLAAVLGEKDTLASSVFVIDPLGRVVLYYDMGQAPRGLLQDLKRLLRWSKIG